jgi:predicted TIM-barrel fold metal-dependent hydrolase
MIIDFHTHIFPDKIAGATINALSTNASIPPHSDGTLKGLLDRMDEGNVEIAINLPVLTRAKQFDSITAFGKETNSNTYGNKRVISFGGMHPDMEDYEENLKLLKREGFLGIKLHPDYQGTFIDDERYIKILSYAKKLDLITVTHAGLDGAFVGQPIKCTPKRVLKLLDALGGYDKLVLAHMGGNELFNEVYDSLAGENLYFDTSYVLPQLGQETFEKITEKHGENKILFATDSPWQSTKKQVEIIKSYKLGKETENKILYENAKELLKI